VPWLSEVILIHEAANRERHEQRLDVRLSHNNMRKDPRSEQHASSVYFYTNTCYMLMMKKRSCSCDDRVSSTSASRNEKQIKDSGELGSVKKREKS
jgi:hypothetical protein